MKEDLDLQMRLAQFIEYKSLSSSQFADTIGMPRPTLSQLLSGRSKSINDIALRKIHQVYPELNIMWLVFGDGSMLSSELGVRNGCPSEFKIQNDPDSDTEILNSEKRDDGNGVKEYDALSKENNNSSEVHDETTGYYRPSRPYSMDDENMQNKQISKIVILYTDGTFEIYK